jgi:hypothetical protein
MMLKRKKSQKVAVLKMESCLTYFLTSSFSHFAFQSTTYNTLPPFLKKISKLFSFVEAVILLQQKTTHYAKL